MNGIKNSKPKLALTQKQRITIGVWIIVIGIFVLCNNYFIQKKDEVYSDIALALSEMIQNIETDDADDMATDDELNDVDASSDSDGVFVNQPYYIGRLEIPKINLIRGFASLGAAENNVNKNIQVIDTSTYPDVDKGNLILAGHTGNAWNCFFRNLYKVEAGDQAIIYYNGKKYTYILDRKYDQAKTGKVRIYRNMSKTTLTLVTCKIHTNDQQTVFIFYLTSVVDA